jgi:hypothetical protein
MNRHRITIIVTILLSGILVLPAGAAAGTMLSGYGGPGAGDQAILGSMLVGGGGGGSAGSSVSSSSSGRLQSQASSETPAGGSGGGASAGKPAQVGRGGSNARSGAGTTSDRPAAAYKESTGSRPRAALSGPSGSELLGLNGSDLIIILIVAGGLVLTAGLTRRLARTPS